MITLITIAAFVFRLIGINQSLWLDEATSALVVRNKDIIGILTEFSVSDFHPPLYYLLLEVWGTVLGTGEVILRLLSVLFGIGTVIITCKIAQFFEKKTLPILAGILLATSPLHIYYSQEARMYAMAAFLVSVSVYLFLKYQSKKSSLIYMTGSGSFFALAFLTDYTTVFMVPAFIAMWFFTSKRKLKQLLVFFLPLLISIIGIFPLFTYQFSSALHVKETGSLWWGILGTFTFKNIALVPIKFVIGRISFENNLIYALYAGVSLGLFSLLVIKAWKDKTKKVLPIIFWLVIPVVSTIAFSAILPVLYYFRLLYVLPALYILIAYGLIKMPERFFMPALLGVLTINLLSSALYFSNTKFQREDWRGLVQYISTHEENSQVVFSANSQMEAFDYYNAGNDRVGPENIDFNKDKIWLMRYVHDIYDPHNLIPEKIDAEGFKKVQEHDFNGIVVWEYEKRNENSN